MQYIAIIIIDRPEDWSKWRSAPSEIPVKATFASKIEAERWIKDFLKTNKFTKKNSRINEQLSDKKYVIKYGIVAIDEKQSSGLENLESLVYWTSGEMIQRLREDNY